MQLFRPEAMRGQDRLHGEVILAPPVSWQVIGVFLLLILVAAGLFLSLAEYSKVTIVAGRLTGSRGIVHAVANRPGRIEAVLVREGQRVERGAPLARIAPVTGITDGDAGPITLAAAEAGIATGIVVQPGDSVAPDMPILAIVPDGSRLQARLELPPDAAGFVAPGQTVRLAIDAFPYQTFGTVEAVVDAVSLTTMPVTRADGSAAEAFLVQATPRADSVRAFGRAQPLRPGMTLTARITTRTRNLAEWLFEPLYAMARR